MKVFYCIILQLFVMLAVAQKSEANRIVITEARAPILYINCENTLNIDVANLCKKESKLIFRSNDATITTINGLCIRLCHQRG